MRHFHERESVCVRACVCVCERERERVCERDRVSSPTFWTSQRWKGATYCHQNDTTHTHTHTRTHILNAGALAKTCCLNDGMRMHVCIWGFVCVCVCVGVFVRV